jgi:hypothetical protein
VGQPLLEIPLLEKKDFIDAARRHLRLGGLDNALTMLTVYEPASPLTEAALCDWIAEARAGHAVNYHEGHLIVDRSELCGALPPRERARLHAMARRAWIACELGLVHLFSQRLGEGRYRYLAVRAATPLAPPQVRMRLCQHPDAAPSLPSAFPCTTH